MRSGVEATIRPADGESKLYKCVRSFAVCHELKAQSSSVTVN